MVDLLIYLLDKDDQKDCVSYRTGNQPPRWYKFDDGEVIECKMDDDEEMKIQCFGGEYLAEVFDHMLKR